MSLPQVAPFRVERLTVSVYRAPVAQPVRTAFGAMTDRPAAIMRAEADRAVAPVHNGKGATVARHPFRC